MSDTIAADLRMMSNIINMGERIAWGSETALMDKAAAHIEAQAERIKAMTEATTERTPADAAQIRQCKLMIEADANPQDMRDLGFAKEHIDAAIAETEAAE